MSEYSYGIDKNKTGRKQLESKLKNQVNYLNTLLENINDVLLTYDTRGIITFITGKSKETIGYNPEELIGRHVMEIVHPGYREAVMEALKERLEKGIPGSYEIMSLHKDGSSRSVWLNASPIFEDGKLKGAMVVAEDITERKNSEEKLHRSVSEIKAIFEALPDLFLKLDREGRILDIKAGKAASLSLIVEKASPQKFCDIISGSSSEKCRQAIGQVLKTGKLFVMEYSKPAGDEERFYEARLIPFLEGQIIAVIRDITDRKKSELALYKSEAKIRALLNAIPDLMFIINSSGVIVDYKATKGGTLVVPTGEAVAPGMLVGRSLYEVCPPDLARHSMQNVERAVKTGEPQIFEYEINIKDKKLIHEARFLASSDNEVLVIVRDITERKAMEDQLKFLSLHDPLTRLYNRAYFEQEMRRLEEGRHGSAGIILCDVDGLKIVNDTLGHDTGDLLLVAAAGVIRESFRAGDMVARIGGDEFAVLLPGCGSHAVEKAAQRIRKKVEQYNSASPSFPLSLSVGFAAGAGSPLSMGELFREADNNMYREKLHRSQSTRSAIVHTLMKALEARDFITEGHADRLQCLVEELAREIGLPDRSVSDLRLLAKFHDIGKVGIPDRILFKKSSLSPAEMSEMRRHCEIGHRIAQSASDLSHIADWILKHHEWFNGEGYPLGLQGDEIPLECRILAIADAYDAMTNNRPYRKAMSHAEALAEIKKFAGSQFDERLVPAFLEVVERLRARN